MAVFITVGTVILLGGIGFAFFSSTVSNANNEKIQTSTATMSLKFDDNDNGVSANLNLGESIVKKFTLENTGTVDAYGKINWYNLVNTYTSDSLTWTLEQSTSENGTYTSVGNGKVPTSSTATTAILKNGLLVPVNTTYYYKLTITLNNLDIDQGSDINARFYSYFNLEEGNQSGVDKLKSLVANSNENSTDVIEAKKVSNSCTNTLAYDGTVDNNLRYVGANPCNYVIFNGETPVSETKWLLINKDGIILVFTSYFDSEQECINWYNNTDEDKTGYECKEVVATSGGWRILGIMNNVDDGTGKKETRIKLVRTDLLGEYSWDSSDSNVNDGRGINDWAQADLMRELNGDYLNTNLNANTYWYDGQYNNQKAEYDYTKGLKQSAQEMIGNAKWYLGNKDIENNISRNYYENERGLTSSENETNNTCSDGYPRNTEWTGKVALMYTSDYGFAVGGTLRNVCLEASLSHYQPCTNNTWIRPYKTNWVLLLNPSGCISVDNIGNFYRSFGYLFEDNAYRNQPVYPSVYLKSDVMVSRGNGSPENPYIFG